MIKYERYRCGGGFEKDSGEMITQVWQVMRREENRALRRKLDLPFEGRRGGGGTTVAGT